MRQYMREKGCKLSLIRNSQQERTAEVHQPLTDCLRRGFDTTTDSKLDIEAPHLAGNSMDIAQSARIKHAAVSTIQLCAHKLIHELLFASSVLIRGKSNTSRERRLIDWLLPNILGLSAARRITIARRFRKCSP